MSPDELTAIEHALMLAPDDAPAALLNDMQALIVSLRAAWAENARYRGALEEVGANLSALNIGRPPGGVRFSDHLDVLEIRVKAALAAPGAGERSEA